MDKFIKYTKMSIICIMLPLFLVSCNTNFIKTIKAPLRIEKPYKHFYTYSLIHLLKDYKNVTISIFYPKLGTNKTIPNEYMDEFNLFINSLKPEYFIDYKTSNINKDNPEYKLTVYVKEKPAFVINILNNKYITIHPWDGSYEPDLIDISKLPEGLNLFNIAEFLIKYSK